MWFYDERRGFVRVVERMTRETFAKTDFSDVIAAVNHNMDRIIGRTSAGTVKLQMDNRGIAYDVDVPQTSYGDDLLVSIERKDIRGSSFMFSVDEDEGWEVQERADNEIVVRPRAVARVYEMGPVSMPAYPETTAESRSVNLLNAVKEYFRQKDEEEKATTEVEPPDYSEIDNLLADL